MKKAVIWLLALLMLCTAAHALTLPADLAEISEGAFEGDASLQGVVSLPEGTAAVGERAFADTGVYALQVPAGCALGADVLSGADAAYIRLAQYAALDAAVLDDVAYVFVAEAAEDGEIALPYILEAETLTQDGMICFIAEDGLFPLCPVDRTALPETVMISKLAGERPIVSLAMLVMPGCEEMALLVPSYLALPEGLAAEQYQTMTASVSLSGADALVHGTEYTFEASVDGAYGDCTLLWAFTLGEDTVTVETTELTCAYTPARAGELTVSVQATDTLGDTAQAEATCEVVCGGVTITGPVTADVVTVGMPATFTTTASCGCEITGYTWTITDGTTSETIETTEPVLTWTPVSHGDRILYVEATDAAGNTAEAALEFIAACGGVTLTQPAADAEPAIGTEMTFTTTASCGCEITGYTWTIADGTNSETFETAEPTLAYTPQIIGSYTLTVTAADAEDNTAEASLTFDVPCRGVTLTQPAADAEPAVGTEVTFTATATCDCEITGYTWTIADGTTSETIETAEPSLTYTPLLAASYTLTVTATDAAGNTAQAALTFDVPCRGVAVEISAADVSPAVGVETTFSASAICDCGIVSYTWTITDGTNTETHETAETILSYTPVSMGSYTLTVTVTDAEGNTAEAAHTFETSCRGVHIEAPAANGDPAVGVETVFTANATCDCGIVSYTWTITDGTGSASFTTTDGTYAYTPTVAGSCTVTVTATDASGVTGSAEAIFDVPCRGVTITQPAADAEPAVGTEVTFTATATCDCEITGYTWTITDGTTPETIETAEPSLTYTPLLAASYTLTVTATDAAGNTAEASLTFDVPCRGVTITQPAADAEPAVGTEVTFTTVATCDCEIIGYTWTITDGTTPATIETAEPSLTCTLPVIGSYTLTVTAMDAAGNTAEASLTFDVPCRGVTGTGIVIEGEPTIGTEMTFTADADCDCEIASVVWSITSADGSTTLDNDGLSCVYTPEKTGEYSVTVTVTDVAGNEWTGSASFTVVCGSVTVEPPTAVVEPAIGTEMTFTTAASCDCEIVSYTWEMTGTAARAAFVTTEPALAFTPEYADIYTLTVTAEDQQGNTASASSGFVVPCAGLTAEAPQAADGMRVGQEAVLSVQAACDCSALFYEWTIGTETQQLTYSTTEPVLPFTPESMEPHLVTVTITDALGGMVTVEATIDVACGGVTIAAPTAQSDVAIGTETVFVTEATCDCTIVSYDWTITDGDLIIQETTAEPSFTYTPTGDVCIVSVTATDEQGGYATAYTEFVLVDYGETVYRAVLIGNTYPDTSNELAGCDTDVYAMRTMLSGMTGTPFTVTAQLNQTASGMKSAISSAFADADANDVSLFYYSGHGTSTGMLVGTSSTYVSSSTLRSWLDEVPGTKIVILDCCYSGMAIAKSEGSTSLSSFNSAVINAFSAINREGELATNGYYVLTACSKTQTSISLSDGTISFGAFTYALCYGSGYDEWFQEALSSMPADSNGDGAITISEAISSIQERIAYLNTMIELTQAMQYYGDTSYTLWSK